MNIGKITDVFKGTGLFLLENLTAILFLIGLSLVVYAVFMWSNIFGMIAAGVALILVALIINSEQGA